MTRETTHRLVRCSFAIAIGLGTLILDLDELTGGELSFTTAQAVIGRPFTPMSYAGVARRTTRRAAYRGAYAGAAYGAYAAAPVYAAPPAYTTQSCTQTTDAYGRVYTTC